MYNVAIVGCGVIGTRLAGSFTEHEATTVWGACDLDEARVEAFAEEWDCEAFTDAETMISNDEVDIVYVGVPPTVHHEMVTTALEHEKHVICEKPIAEDADVGQELADCEAETDRVTAVNLPFRYTPGFVEMRERVQAGEVGDPQRISLTFRFPQWPREWQDVAWLEGREQGGPLREVGTHYLFGVQEIFGGIDRVTAEVEYSGPDRYEESIVGYFTAGAGSDAWGDGIPGTIDLVTDCAADEQNSITVLGTETQFSLLEWYRLVEHGEGADESSLNEMREQTTVTLVDEFVKEMEGVGGDLVSFAEATQVQRVVDAIFASDGERVTVEN
jgi:predicted dehydrogenase